LHFKALFFIFYISCPVNAAVKVVDDRNAGTGVHYRDTASPDLWKGGQRGHRCLYITVS